ncbi:RNA-directed RNA polymerase [ssRNA phage SRR6050738_1]|uniref:RNA-directed RNA polymerase n=1 Tax=ssRNA phage SRR6050738_1 TaxID=2786484 RepID=A0A8S5KZV7_9VIRU|nr:RNA-directed RNA polymerase [ssRNA phage SRR6050738_1]DAD50613.1 TPA_asm: RNA-directed RNA polymerase [ssRNA phage SRR6050738_1]
MAPQDKLLSFCNTLSEELRDAKQRTPEPERDFARNRFNDRLRKRARLGAPGLTEKAIADFREVNQRVFSINLDLDRDIEHIARVFISEAFEHYNATHDPELIQVSYDYRHLLRFWRFGPGASHEVTGTHTAEKLSQPMSVTPSCKSAVLWLRDNNPYLAAHDLLSSEEGIHVVAGSHLTTVPKNETTERTIAIEPSGNMALQLALGEYISDVLRRIGLDIRDQQPKNKLLAMQGSITDGLVIIDLKSASDMFSIKLVKRLLPDGVYRAMMHFRSPQTVLPNGDVEVLHMMSTMGNGFTFPMMTLIFAALVYANGVKQGTMHRWIDWTKRAVFGDDIIVPSCEAESLITILVSCGFIVNRDKSYLEGPFRESCGGDYYYGYDVTPVYVKSLDSDPEIYVAINKLFEWCAQHNLLLPRSLELLFSYLDHEVCFVPEWEGNDAGFRTTEVPRKYSYYKVKSKRVRYKEPFFQTMLCCGGYLTPVQAPAWLDFAGKPDAERKFAKALRKFKSKGEGEVCGFYTPRPFKTRYVRKQKRMPSGFSSGRDCHSRSDHVSRYVESYAFLARLFGN